MSTDFPVSDASEAQDDPTSDSNEATFDELNRLAPHRDHTRARAIQTQNFQAAQADPRHAAAEKLRFRAEENRRAVAPTAGVVSIDSPATARPRERRASGSRSGARSRSSGSDDSGEPDPPLGAWVSNRG